MARALVCLLAVTLFVFAAGSLSFDTKQRPGAGPAPSSSQRIVTLAPALTETLFAIGAGDRVVGVSDHCRYPAAIAGRQRAGSWLSPNYEALARLEPSLIVTSAEVSGPLAPLLRIAPTERLAWFSLDDMLKSILRLGALSGRASEARALVHALESKLTRPAPPTAPRLNISRAV
jgi:iron complex transport system substrate-binding protein